MVDINWEPLRWLVNDVLERHCTAEDRAACAATVAALERLAAGGDAGKPEAARAAERAAWAAALAAEEAGLEEKADALEAVARAAKAVRWSAWAVFWSRQAALEKRPGDGWSEGWNELVAKAEIETLLAAGSAKATWADACGHGFDPAAFDAAYLRQRA